MEPCITSKRTLAGQTSSFHMCNILQSASQSASHSPPDHHLPSANGGLFHVSTVCIICIASYS